METNERSRIQQLEARLGMSASSTTHPDLLGDLGALAELYLRADSYVPALEILDRVLALPELADRGDPRRLALEIKALECLRLQGRFSQAASRGLEALAGAPAEAPPDLRARLQLEIVDALTNLSRYEEARAHAQQAMELVRAIGDGALLAKAITRAGILWMRLGDWLVARDLFEEARALFQRLGDEGQVANVQATLGVVHKNLCEWAVALHHLRESLARERRLGRYAKIANRLLNLGIVYLKSGEWAKAHESFVEARQICRQVGNQWGLTGTALALGIHARLTGRYEEADRYLKEGLERSLGAGLLREESLAREYLGDLAFDRGEPEAALESYRQALTLAERTAPVGDVMSEILRRMAEAHAAVGDPAAAREALDRCRRVCDLLDDRYEGAVLHRVAGQILWASGDGDGALREWRAAANLLGEMGERFERGRALFLLARHVSDPAEARKFAYRASACFAEVGADRELGEVESWLAERVSGGGGDRAPEARRPRLASRRLAESVGLIGVSRGLERVLDLVERAARTDLTVVVRGETGTGKELVARAIHAKSGRADKPFLPVNCGALRADLALSQLFGHRRGAFTGAHMDGTGLVEAAHTGTLLLDEVGELPLDVQVTLLRFLERGDYLRLGETIQRHADVRVICATHVDLRRAVAEGRFRADLFYRLHEIEITLPALAERVEDVIPLAHHFLRLHGGESPPALSPEAAALLTSYSWPGNVRELANCIKRVLALSRDERVLRPVDLLPHLEQLPPVGEPSSPLPGERATLLAALEQSQGNKSRAAALLGVSRKTLYARLRRLGIPLEGEDQPEAACEGGAAEQPGS